MPKYRDPSVARAVQHARWAYQDRQNPTVLLQALGCEIPPDQTVTWPYLLLRLIEADRRLSMITDHIAAIQRAGRA